jgi:hypothetical protein
VFWFTGGTKVSILNMQMARSSENAPPYAASHQKIATLKFTAMTQVP